MRQDTHLQIMNREMQTENQIRLEGVLLDLPLGHRITLDPLTEKDGFRKGVYEVFEGPHDYIMPGSSNVLNCGETLYDRFYGLRAIEEKR